MNASDGSDPERKEMPNHARYEVVKEIAGWVCYLRDKYGHTVLRSKHFRTEEAAINTAKRAQEAGRARIDIVK